MGAGTPQERKSYTKIKNFTEKDQVRIKYSKIGADKKLMLSVYIGEDVYKELTGGVEYKRINCKYIPNDMLVVTPTNNEKEGIIHRYNGSGMFKTTCLRISLGKMKDLKLSKHDFENRVVEYSIIHGGINEPNNALRIDISNSKKIRFTIGKKDKDVAKQPIENNVTIVPDVYGYSEQNLANDLYGYGEQKHGLVNKGLTAEKARKEKIEGLDVIRNSYTKEENPFLARQKVEGGQIPYFPFNDLDEINEKLDKLVKNQECLSEKLSSILELLNVKEKYEYVESQESIANHKRMAIMEVRISNLEKKLETMNSKVDKSLFERIFGK